MKKSIYSILALAILLVSACSQEEIVDVSKGEGQPVTIKVELPSVDARAITGEIGIGKGSLINQLVFSMYEEDQRNSEPLITQFVSRENDGSFLVTVPMAKDMKYDFLFLAYNKENPAFVLHTNDAKANNLNELKLKTELSANQESYDAFIGRLDSKGIDATATTTVTLTRPFAQINAATTASDLDEVKALGTEVNASDFKIYDVPNTLNVFTGEVSGRVNLEFKKDTILTKYNATDYPRNEELVVGSDIYKYLAMAYVLADKRSNNYDADFKFYRSDNQTIRHLSVVNMPIQANYRTNVVGTFLTQQENYEIHIDEVFEKPANDVTGAKQIMDETDMKAAIEAATIGQTLKLIADITLSETLTVPADKIITLDLNGKRLTVNAAESTYAINNLGTLILKDSFVGTRSAGNTGGSLTARGIYNGYGNGGENVATAKIIVENGTYHAVGTNGGAAIYNYGIAEIKGGDFTSIGGYSLNNQKDASMTISEGVTVNNGIYCSSATLVVNGGELKGNRSGCHVIYAWDSNLTINGGDFYNNNSGNATLMAAGTSAVTVNKGTFGIKDGRIPNNGNTFTSYLLDLCDSASMTLENGTFNGGFRIQAGTSLTINGGMTCTK